MNNGSIPFTSGENSRRNGIRTSSNLQGVASNTEHHRSNRVRFPDEPISSEAYPRLQGHFGSHKFQNDGDGNSILDFFIGAFIFCLTIICICGSMTILVILYLTVRPFSVNLYRRLSAQMCTATFLDAMALLLPNTRLIVTGDSDIPTPVGCSVLVCNHLLDGEWWALLMLGRCVGFRGTMKAFLRNEFLQINLDDVETTNRQSHSPTSSTTSNLIVNRSTGSGYVPSSPTPACSTQPKLYSPPSDLSLAAKLLHLFLEFPLLNDEDSGTPDREKLFALLRSFAADNAAATAPVHLIFFPEAWSMHNNPNGHNNTGVQGTATAADRRAILAKSNEFAKREGKPQLKCLLLPRTRIFNASLECLRESNPLVYDVTLAYSGYDGSLPSSVQPLSMTALFFGVLRRKLPKEIHIRIKRYSMEEVLHIDNVNWLVKKWAEKDRLLTHFARHQQFPNDSRGYYGRPRVFNTRFHSLESSVSSLSRLLIIMATVPVLILLSIPLCWTVFWIWVITKVIQFVHEYLYGKDNIHGQGIEGGLGGRQTPGSVPSAASTPFFPATPFASPNILNWNHSMFSGGESKGNGTTMHTG